MTHYPSMHAGLLALWVTGVLLFPQSLGGTDESEYDYEFVTPSAGYNDYEDYTSVYETDTYTTSIDYDLFETPSHGIKQSIEVNEKALHGGINQINDEASTVCRYYAVVLGLIVQRFCQI